MIKTSPSKKELKRIYQEASSCTERWCVLLKSIENIPTTGHILEFGVFRGTSINLLASRLSQRDIVGFDSFRGLPEPWKATEGNMLPQGYFNLNGNPPKVPKNVKLVKGWFEDSLPKTPFFKNQQLIGSPRPLVEQSGFVRCRRYARLPFLLRITLERRSPH